MARGSGVREDRHFFTRNGMRLLHHKTTWEVVHVIKCIHLELLLKKFKCQLFLYTFPSLCILIISRDHFLCIVIHKPRVENDML